MEGALYIPRDLTLFETIYWDGQAAPRWPLHLARLRRSAVLLGWPAPEVHPQGPDHPARLRLSLTPDGALRWEVFDLPPAPVAPWRLVLAGARLDPADPWLAHKSNQRGRYDAARAALPAGADEVIFANRRGEICEGTITNVFFDRGQGLRTPPLSSGLLPGVLRAEIGCPEEVLRLEDAPRVKIWVGNALRGLIPAIWCG